MEWWHFRFSKRICFGTKINGNKIWKHYINCHGTYECVLATTAVIEVTERWIPLARLLPSHPHGLPTCKLWAILYLLCSPPPSPPLLGPAICNCQPLPAPNLALGPRLLEVIPRPLFLFVAFSHHSHSSSLHIDYTNPLLYSTSITQIYIYIYI